ncbi:MAG: hypothetical protein AAGI37_09140 [Planctomycetota bacterium]
MVPLWTWLILRRVSRIAVVLGLLWMLGAVFVGPLFNAAQSFGYTHPVGIVVGSMMEFRFFLRELLTMHYPEVGRAIYYTGLNRTDWHLLGLFIVLFWLRKVIGFGVCRLVVIVLYPLISRGFKVTIYRDTVVIQKRFRSLKLRHSQQHGGVTFRVAGPKYQTGLIGKLLRTGKLKPDGDVDFCVVQVIAQGRPIKIAAPRKMVDAERIVQSLMMAMNTSTPASALPTGVIPRLI